MLAKIIENTKRVLPEMERRSVSLRRLANAKLNAIYAVVLFIVYVCARSRKELDKLSFMSLNIALDRYSADCEELTEAKWWLRGYILKEEIMEPISEQLKGVVPEKWSKERLGWKVCDIIFDSNVYSGCETNYLPNLAEIILKLQDDKKSVLLLAEEMGFLPYLLAMNGIDCFIRCSNREDAFLARLLSFFVNGHINAEYVKQEDMYKATSIPMSSVICLLTPYLVLENLSKHAKERYQGVLKKLHWHSGKVIFFTMEDRPMNVWARKAETNILKDLVESGYQKMIVKLPHKDGVARKKQPIMLCLDLSAERFDGILIADISSEVFLDEKGKEIQEKLGRRFLKTEVINDLLFTHRLLWKPEYADYICTCQLEEMRKNNFSLDASCYLWGTENRMAWKIACESGVILQGLAEVIICPMNPTVPEESDVSEDCFVLVAADLSHNHGTLQPTKRLEVKRSYAEQYRVRQGDILTSVKDSKDRLGTVCLVKDCPDNWIISPSVAIIRLKDDASLKRLSKPLGFWFPERLFKYLTSKAVRAYLKNKISHSDATTAIPIDMLRELPVIVGDLRMQQEEEELRHQLRMKVLGENNGYSVPDFPELTQNQIGKLEPVTISVDFFSEIGRNPFPKFNTEPVQS